MPPLRCERTSAAMEWTIPASSPIPAFPTAGYLAVLEPDGGLMIGIADMSIYDAVDAAWVSRAVERAAGADLWVFDANLPESVLVMLADRARVPVLADPVSVAKAIRLRPIMGGSPGSSRSGRGARLAGRDPPPDANAAAIEAAAPRRGGLVGPRRRPPPTRVVSGPPEPGPPCSGPVVDVTGAGDALLAGYRYGLGRRRSRPTGVGTRNCLLRGRDRRIGGAGLTLTRAAGGPPWRTERPLSNTSKDR